MNTTERSAAIRAELKKRGWSSRDVSVKTDYYSMGSSIDVRIKNPNVPLAAVKEIAEAHERIDRCEITGEILSGCNRYVNVSYSHDALAALAAKVLGPVNDAAAKLAVYPSENVLIPIDGTNYLLGYGRHGKSSGFAIWHKNAGHAAEAYNLTGVAEYIGVGGWNH